MATLSVGGNTVFDGSTLQRGVQPGGSIQKYEFARTTNTAHWEPTDSWQQVPGSNISYTPVTGATYVWYNCRIRIDSHDTRMIVAFRISLDGTTLDYTRVTIDNDGATGEHENAWENFDATIPGWSGAKTVQLESRVYSGSYEARFHRNNYYKETDASGMEGTIYTPTEVTIYSLM